VVYASSTSALATGSALTFDGTNLGLGVTPSAWGSSYRAFEMASAGLMSNTNGGSFFFINNAYYNGTNWIYKYTQLASRYDQSSGVHAWYNAPSGTAGNAITFTQALTLNTNGALVLQGGTTSASGVGVAFPATQSASSDANTLDDYEEGTWTPTFTPATSGTITLGSPNLCAYTKIGRVVTVNGLTDTASVSLPIGSTITIGGLPFASNATGTQRSAGTARCFSLTTGSLNATMVITSSATTMIIYVDASLFQLGSQVYFQLSYTV
jgi:hypothetical protein